MPIQGDCEHLHFHAKLCQYYQQVDNAHLELQGLGHWQVDSHPKHLEK